MMMRCDDQTVMYGDAEEIPAPHNTTPLETTSTTHSILKLDSETTTKYSEDISPQRDLAWLQEHFQQLQETLNQLGPTAKPPVHIEELAHLNNKLQQLAMTVQPCSPCSPLHTAMQKYTATSCTTQQQTNLTTSLLQDIPTCDGWDTMKLEDWLSDIEMAADILKESCTHLTEAKSCSLTNTLVCKAL